MKALTTQLANASASTTNLVPTANYGAGSPGSYTLTGLIVGQTYTWIPGANDSSIVVSGSITLTTAGVFTASGTTVALKGTGGAAITAIVSFTVPLYPAIGTPTLPARQITVGQFSALNPNWSRVIQISDQFVFVKHGNYAVCISLADIANIALCQEPNLTWSPPIILTQPASAACVATAAATGTLTNDGTNVSNGDTVTIGTKVYTFQTTLTNVDGNVHIGASNTASMTNLFHAINATGGTPGTDYATAMTANTQVTATNPTGTTVVVTAITSGTAGDNIASTETSSHLSWGAATLTGGTVTAATFTVSPGSEYVLTYQWQYSADGATSWTNCAGTVNGCAYSNGTTATLTCTPTTNGQTGYSHRCVITDDAGAYGLTNGSVTTNTVILTIP